MTTTAEPVTETGTLHIMDPSGDVRISWNKDNPDEVAAAKAAFDRAKSREGGRMLGYRVEGKKGQKLGEVVREFDPTAERLVMSPQQQGG